MIKRSLLFLFLVIINTSVFAQNNIDKVLEAILRNNKTIAVNQLKIKAKKTQYQTNLSLENPFVEIEHIKRPKFPNTQTDFSIIQPFNPPTFYRRKKEIANLQIKQANSYPIVLRQEILLKAKQICIHVIYWQQKQNKLKSRIYNSNQIHQKIQQKFNLGEANILEVNKSRLQLISIQNDSLQNAIEIQRLNKVLQELNGGILVEFSESTYPIVPFVLELDVLLDSISRCDPFLQSLRQEVDINQKRAELSKTKKWPKMEVGYRYQAVMNQHFHGVHFGFTIPIWEGKKTAEFQQAQMTYSQSKIKEYTNSYLLEIESLYEQYQNLNKALANFKAAFSALNSPKLLKKALILGEISSIEYFMEVNFFYNSIDKLFELEKDCYLVLAKLQKYQL